MLKSEKLLTFVKSKTVHKCLPCLISLYLYKYRLMLESLHVCNKRRNCKTAEDSLRVEESVHKNILQSKTTS